MTPRGIALAMLLLGFLFLALAFLTGCGTTWNAKLLSEPDWKQGPDFMPSAEIGFGGSF